MIGIIGRLERTFQETIKPHIERNIMFTFLGSPYHPNILEFEDIPVITNDFKFVTFTTPTRVKKELEYISQIENSYTICKIDDNTDNNLIKELTESYNNKIVFHGNKSIIDECDCYYMIDLNLNNLDELDNNKLKCVYLKEVNKDIVQRCKENNIDIFTRKI